MWVYHVLFTFFILIFKQHSNSKFVIWYAEKIIWMLLINVKKKELFVSIFKRVNNFLFNYYLL